MTPGRTIIAELDRKFPGMTTHALARAAYKQAPKCFSTLNAAYVSVRQMRNGRKKYSGAGALRPCLAPTPCDHNPLWDLVPQASSEYKIEWAPVIVSGPLRVLILSDVHIPYHQRDALILALETGRRAEVNMVLLNGDVVDFQSVSFWNKDPNTRDIVPEIKTACAFLDAVRTAMPKVRILYKEGNHEERLWSYLTTKAPELFNLDMLQVKSLLKLRDHEHVGDMRPIRLGDLNVIHGHEYGQGITNPVNPARGLFLRAKAYALCAHYHQSSYHSETTIADAGMAAWSTGCLCKLHPRYRPLNKWGHGFAIVEVDSRGKFEVHNHTIKSGKVY